MTSSMRIDQIEDQPSIKHKHKKEKKKEEKSKKRHRQDESEQPSKKQKKDLAANGAGSGTIADQLGKHKEKHKKEKRKKAHKRKHESSKKRRHAHESEQPTKKQKTDHETTITPTTSNSVNSATNKNDMSGSASDTDEEENEVEDRNNDKQKKKKKYRTTNHRLIPMMHAVYDSDVDAKVQYDRRRVRQSNHKVNPDFFISDSESDTDSDASYSHEPDLPWHRSIDRHAKIREKVAKEGWNVKTGKWSADERLKLEKRIKKICRRENMTMQDFRETILKQKPATNMHFWWKVARVFPDRALGHIVRHTIETYEEKQYSGRWTKEEDELLLRLVEEHGRNFKQISQYMERSPQAICNRYMVLQDKKKRVVNRWTEEDLKTLAKAVSEYEEQHGKNISWAYIAETAFKKERSAWQCRQKWREIEVYFKHGEGKVITKVKDVDIPMQLALVKRMKEMGWQKEDDIKFAKLPNENLPLSSRVCQAVYYKIRKTITGFEKMSLPDVLQRLIDTREAMVRSLQEP